MRRYTGYMNSPSVLRRGVSFAVFSGVLFLAVLGLLHVIDPYPLRDWIYLRLSLHDLGAAGPIIFILLAGVLPLFSPLNILVVTGSASFGPVVGMILSYLGALINANITFILVKALGVEDKWGNSHRQARIKRNIQRNGYPIVLLLQIISIFPFVAINSAAAAAGIGWRDFMKANLLGVILPIAVYSFFGEAIVLELLSPRMYCAFIIVIFLTIVIVALREKRNSHRGRGQRQLRRE
ncbi:MAG: hypothetical protein AVO39_00150 [delta proteobacterium MLS_D]|nr:MAG: hypothetical protein AVO39_00150 [delta proteobacterium MLS_D]